MTHLSEGSRKIIKVGHINLQSNRKRGTTLPVVTVDCENELHEGFHVRISGVVETVYHPDRGKLWLETTGAVTIEENSDG